MASHSIRNHDDRSSESVDSDAVAIFIHANADASRLFVESNFSEGEHFAVGGCEEMLRLARRIRAIILDRGNSFFWFDR